MLTGCIIVEACIAHVAMRGTILDPTPRASMQYLLYVRLGEYIFRFIKQELLFGIYVVMSWFTKKCLTKYFYVKTNNKSNKNNIESTK